MNGTARKILLLTWISWFWSHGTRVGIPAITPFIRQRLEISTAEAAAIPGLLNLGFYSFAYFSGKLATKIGSKNGVVYATLGSGVVLGAASLAENVYVMYAGVFATGLFLSMHLPSAIPWLGRLFKGPRQGLTIGIHESAAPTGQTLGPLVLAFLISTTAFSAPLLAWALVPVLTGLSLMFIREGSRETHAAGNRLQASANPRTVPLTVLTTANLVGNLGVVAIVPLHLVDTFGLDKGFVASVVGASRLLGVFGQPLGGHLHDRFGFLRVAAALTTINLVSNAYLMLGPYSEFYAVVMVVQAASTAMYFPLVYSHLVRNFGPAASTILGKMFTAAGIVGPTSAPFIAGFIAERMGYSAALAYPTGLAAAGVASLFFLRREGKI
ncbi:MAG: MFS transporter [Candidatus Caldarchaeum sp.]